MAREYINILQADRDNNPKEVARKKEIFKYIDSLVIKEQTLSLEVLDFAENYVADIEGVATSGSISINGSSAVRRSGSLSLAVSENSKLHTVTDIESTISLNKKVRVTIGIKNSGYLYPEYEIFWFTLGVFYIKSAQVTNNNSGVQLSISIIDKMGALNGEFGGTIYGATTHSPIKVENDYGEETEEPVEYYVLIQSLVRDFGNVPTDWIHIKIPKSLGQEGYLEQGEDYQLTAKWSGSGTLYVQAKDDKTAENKREYKISRTEFTNDVTPYSQYDNIGYKLGPLVYSGNLSSSGGETVVSVLDKIKNSLGNFEYFFDVDGQFYFQEIQNGLYEGGSDTEDWEEAIKNGYILEDTREKEYEFIQGNNLITSYSNDPQYIQIKNDFLIWGKFAGDKTTAIRYHLMIMDVSKIKLQSYYVQPYEDKFGVTRVASAIMVSENDNSTSETKIQTHDWRQELYLRFIAEKNQSIFAKELIEEFPKIYNVLFDSETGTGWKYTVNYGNLRYYVDAIDVSQLKKYDISVADFSIDNIGTRTKVVNDDKVNCIFAKEPQDLYFLESEDQIEKIGNDKNYVPLYDTQNNPEYKDLAPNIEDQVTLKSAYSVIRTTLHQYIGYNNNISLQAIPMYYLEPNIKIQVEDDDSDIHGQYVIKTFTLPLGVDGTMSVSANKVITAL